jgi:hypothetical protein
MKYGSGVEGEIIIIIMIPSFGSLIRIRGSVPLEPGPSFFQWLPRCQQKKSIFIIKKKKFLTGGPFPSGFKDNRLFR